MRNNLKGIEWKPPEEEYKPFTNYTAETLGKLLSYEDDKVKRLAIGILRRLQKLNHE
jgi:hypothetical protein